MKILFVILLYACWTFIFNILSLKYVIAVTLTIGGPNFVKLGEPIAINCSSDSIPVGKSAEFLINEKSYTSLVSQDNGCYSGVIGEFCSPTVCQCLHDGRTFWLVIEELKTAIIKISCVMKFFDGEKLILKDDELIVQNIDVKGPFISTKQEQPLSAGTTVDINCVLISPIRNFTISWDCFGATVQKQYRINETMLVSKAYLDVKSDYKGQPCSCLASTGHFMLMRTLKLDVINLPVLNIVGDRECNATSVLLLSCLLSGELKHYGFNDWIHIFNGTFIRRLKGKQHGNTSVLMISSCSYQDGGEYICAAWNRYSVGIFSTNISKTVSINGPPTIIDMSIFKNTETIISVIVYSLSSIFKVEWFVNNKAAENDSNIYMSSVENITIPIKMYGTLVHHPGSVVNLTITDNTPGIYEVQLSNRFGKTRRHIEIYARGNDFHLVTVTWVLVVISVFLLTCTFGLLSSNREHLTGSFNWHPCIERKIYFAAAPPPSPEINMRTYDRTDPHYDEILPDDDYEQPNPVINTDSSVEDVNPYIEPIY